MSKRKGGKGLLAALKRRPRRGAAKAPRRNSEGIPGPSDNPATNFFIADLAIRAGSYLARRGVEKGLLANRYGKDTAHSIVENKSIKQTLFSAALARVATRSVPGAILVGGGAVAKTLLDRRKSRLSAKAEGDRKLLDQARGE